VAWILLTSPFACRTERLTGVSAADDFGAFDLLPVDFFDVAMIWHLRPMFCQHFASVGVDFGLPNDTHPCPFKTEV